ncbi:TPA: hypothetical protein OMU21_004867 [Klebsiella aerogenes]|nr:hypothetical protein [Klebsiella aerogenes]
MKYIILFFITFSTMASPLKGFICTGSFTDLSFNQAIVYHLSLEFGDNGKGYYRFINSLSNKTELNDEVQGEFQYEIPPGGKLIQIASERNVRYCNINNTSKIPFYRCGETLLRGVEIANSIRLIDYSGTIMICTPPP